jgi:hypothetical protein
VHRSANTAPPVPIEERSSEHVDDGGSGSQQIDHRLKPRGMANLETGMISTLVGRRWHGLDVDQLLENLINAGGSKVRLAIITGQLQSIKNGRSSSILPERATRIRGRSGSRLRNRCQCK